MLHSFYACPPALVGRIQSGSVTLAIAHAPQKDRERLQLRKEQADVSAASAVLEVCDAAAAGDVVGI